MFSSKTPCFHSKHKNPARKITAILYLYLLIFLIFSI